MVMRSDHQIQRRRSRPVRVGRVTVGGDAPIVVQSMTNTDTVDVIGTAIQVNLSMVTIEESEVTKRLAAWAGIFAVALVLATRVRRPEEIATD